MMIKVGASLDTYMEFRDKKTGKTKLYYFTELDFAMFDGAHVYEKINSFIVKACKVWEFDKENPNYHY